MRKSPPTFWGADHPLWKGDDAGYSAVHSWLRRNFPKSGVCEDCGATECRLEYANVSGEYRRDRKDYKELCNSCHGKLDFGDWKNYAAVRLSESWERSKNSTHCKRGHEFTTENTLRQANGARRCRECRNMNARAYYHRKKKN